MKPLIIFIIAVLLVAFVLLQTIGRISIRDAREHLKDGALVIDVRSPGEFASDHLANAINFPLDEIEATLPARVQDNNRVLLLHCQSATRSAIAAGKLKRIGYTNVFNLGSLARAREIVDMAKDE